MKNNNFSSPKENRGGSCLSLNDEKVTNSIIDHIQNLKAKKSHYSRTDTGCSSTSSNYKPNVY
jgi:hypothetical protein